jgi:hypothetical protein
VISCTAGPTVAAAAPLASDNDNPAAPKNGTAHARLFFCLEACFARDMVEFPPIPWGKCFEQFDGITKTLFYATEFRGSKFFTPVTPPELRRGVRNER